MSHEYFLDDTVLTLLRQYIQNQTYAPKLQTCICASYEWEIYFTVKDIVIGKLPTMLYN